LLYIAVISDISALGSFKAKSGDGCFLYQLHIHMEQIYETILTKEFQEIYPSRQSFSSALHQNMWIPPAQPEH